MRGFIFTAGHGERLEPITSVMPKSLVPVLNVPSLCYSVMLLKEAGICEVVCNLHYMYREIIRFLELNDLFDLDITFSIENAILGTGGGLKKCENVLSDDDFIIINSDIIMDIDLREVIEYHKSTKAVGTVVLYKTNMAEEIGMVSIEENCVIDFKDFLRTGVNSDFIYTGVAVLSPLIFEYLYQGFSSIVYTGFIDIIRHHSLSFYEHSGFWQDIGTVESYWSTNMHIMKNIVLFKDRLSITDQILEVISDEAEIHKNAVVKDSIIGEGSYIGGDIDLENSIVLPYSYLDCKKIIQNSVVLGDRVIKIGE